MLRLRLFVRRLLGAHPLVGDVLLAVAVTGVTLKLAHGSYPAHGVRRFDALALALTLLANLPLVLRRYAPTTTVLLCEAGLVGYEAGGYWLGLNQLGAQLALASLASSRGRGWTVAGAVLIAPGMMYGNVHTWNGSTVDIVALSLAWIVAICAVGDLLRRLRTYSAIVAQNAERLRAEQREREQRAVLLERVRVARELHDIVAHHMSVVAVQAGLARYVLTTDPETVEKALRSIAEMSSEALEEVRRLVTMLRPEPDQGGGEADGTDRDTPGVADLPVMIERVGLTGVAIEYDVSGEVQPLPAGVGLCVYRVVQESLTNAIKHAPGARVVVSLHYAANRITARIANDGRRSSPPDGRPEHLGGGGKGLIGMYERALLYGGTLTAGGQPDGGFEVVLTLPIRAGGSAPAERGPYSELRTGT
ncbi:MAG TPA: sensor histidine kinase [Micromonosporaceae bacterium]